MNSIRFLCRLMCASWLPCLRISGSELDWDLVFELGLPVDMVLGSPDGYTLVYSINMFILLALRNSFGAWEGY